MKTYKALGMKIWVKSNTGAEGSEIELFWRGFE